VAPADARSLGTPSEFASPGPWNAPAAYWFWHRVPTHDEIVDQVALMARAGYQGFQIQARMSFPLDAYLSDAYLAACADAADEAARAGMVVGIYDEYNWLSGHAGGRTVAGRDELRERHLFHATGRRDADGRVRLAVDGIRPVDVEYLLEPGMAWVFEGGTPRWDEWEVVAAVAHDAGQGAVDVTAGAALVRADDDGCAVLVGAGPGSEVTVFVAARCRTSRMINYLRPDAAERFLEVGYEPYARAFGQHLGSTVRYVFYDQPHACFFDWAQNDGTTGSSLMFDPVLVARLREATGDRLAEALLALARDAGPGSGALRATFFEVYAALGIDAFFGTLACWCHDHGLLLSGHEVLGHVSTWDPAGTIITDDARTNFGLDYFGIDAWRDVTAVDARNSAPQLSAKLGDSVARSHGRTGCVVEQYYGRVVPGSHFAAGWWELTLGELRAQTLRHHVLGARQLLMHAFWLTDGYEGEDLFVNPRFDFAPGINFEPWFDQHRAFADESARVSVFADGMEPLGEVAVLYPLRTAWAGGPDHVFGEHTAFWTEHLARLGLDYHLVDERELRASSVDGTRLRLADRRSYRALVLPAAEVVEDERTVELVGALAAAGGAVLASGPLPAVTQTDGPRPDLRERLATAIADGAASRWWPDVPAPAEVAGPLAAAAAGALEVDSDGPGQLWVRRGRDHSGTRVILFNDGPARRVVTLRPATLPAVVRRWDPATGDVGPAATVDGAPTLWLEPGEVALVHVADGVRPVAGRRLLADGWQLDAGGRLLPVDPARGWETQGLSTWGSPATYRAAVELGPDDTGADAWELRLPVVHGSAGVEVNGTHLGDVPWSPGGVVVPAGVLRPGPNEIAVRVAPSAANAYYAGTGQQGDGLAPSGLGAAPVLRPVLDLVPLPPR